jgi:hypothetical protein
LEFNDFSLCSSRLHPQKRFRFEYSCRRILGRSHRELICMRLTSLNIAIPTVSHSSWKRQHDLGLLLLFLLGMTLFCVPRLNESIWQDEWWSLYHSGSGIYGPIGLDAVWSRVITQDPLNAPAYYLVLNVWHSLVGSSLFGLRALSMFAGLLAVAMTYRIGRDLFNRQIALYAVVIIGAQATTLHYMHELRGYTLVLLMATFVIWGYWNIVSRRRTGLFPYFILFIGVTGILYTHYLASFLLAAVALYHLLFIPKNRHWFRVPLVMGLAALLFLPQLPTLLNTINNLDSYGWWLDLLHYSSSEVVILMLRRFSNENAGLLLLLLVSGIFLRTAHRKSYRFIAITFISAFALLLITNFLLAFVIGIQYLFFLLPLVALLSAFGIAYLARIFPIPLILGLWIVFGIWGSLDGENLTWYMPGHPPILYQEMFQSLKDRAEAGDLALFATPEGIYRADAYEGLLDYYLKPLGINTAIALSGYATPDEFYYEQAATAVTDMERVWLIYDETQRPWRVGPLEERVLPEAGLVSCGNFGEYPPVNLSLWVRPLLKPTLELTGITGTLVNVSETQDQLEVSMVWDAPTLPSDRFSFGVYLFNEQGESVAQTDDALPVERLQCKTVAIDTSELPKGQYTLQTAVYDYRTLERVDDALVTFDNITLR